MHGWRIAFIVAHILQIILIVSFLKEYHFVDPALYATVVEAKSLDAIHVASELGRFDMASMFLAGISILIAIAAVFGFLEIRGRSEKIAAETAKKVSETYLAQLLTETHKLRGPEGPSVPLNNQGAVIAQATELGESNG